MLSLAAIAAVMILPATGVAKASDAKQDAALVKAVGQKISGLTTGLATVKTKLSATNSAAAILSTKVAAAQSDITALQGSVATAQASITSINTQLTAGAAALTAINSALQNSTTGLVGLNAARPQFGAFQANGTIIAGTGQVTGASGPKTNATEGAGALADFYVVDFGDDVSARFLQVTPFPTGAAAAGVPMAVDCGATASASSLCGLVETGSGSDASKNHVVIQFGTAGGAAPAAGWEVAAISG
jgi:hypothetical protein